MAKEPEQNRKTTTDRNAVAEIADLVSEQPAMLPAVVERQPSRADEHRRQDVDHWGRSESARKRAARLYEPIYSKWFRAELSGIENVPTTGGALLVANHAGALPPDAPLIIHGVEKEVGRPVYGMAEHLFRSVPFVGTAWARGGGVAGHPENAHRLLHDEGQLALVFPEGAKGPGKKFTERYQLARFGRGGFVEVAMRAGVPIIPIAVVGAEEAMPNITTLPRLAKIVGLPFVPVTPQMLVLGPLGVLAYAPAKFEVRFLEPVEFADKPNLPRYSRARVMEHADQIRDQIQAELYDMLRERRSVWFG